MVIKKDINLAEFTSFGVGGKADKLIVVDSADELCQSIEEHDKGPLRVLGYGTNVLISDYGLDGTTVITHKGTIDQDNLFLIAGAGVWWDDLVQFAIEKNLWGLELTSGVPGGVGGAVFININAYGQSMADTLQWVEVINTKSKKIQKLRADDLTWGYKQSIFQLEENKHLAIVSACFKLSNNPTCELTYQKALDIAIELGIEPNSLDKRRQIILEARNRAGSIYIPNQGYEKTVGSFFRNPIVSKQQAELVMSYDESGKTKDQIMSMNRVHGGSEYRVSAAHVLLACDFIRGQTWGGVQLHPKNLLKIENTGNATAQEIYDVSRLIMQTVKQKLGIILEPEVRILGQFNN